MITGSIQSYEKEIVRQQFDRCYTWGTLNSFWAKLYRKSSTLLTIRTAYRGAQVARQSDAGLQTVPIGQIVGSENRGSDFDRQWRPLKSKIKERWTNMALAYRKNVYLPAVDLIQIGNAYFVRDGHHRISVAKFHNQLEIEANVVVWAYEDTAQPSLSQVVKAVKPTPRALMPVPNYG